jgi:hypothetical protein
MAMQSVAQPGVRAERGAAIASLLHAARSLLTALEIMGAVVSAVFIALIWAFFIVISMGGAR